LITNDVKPSGGVPSLGWTRLSPKGHPLAVHYGANTASVTFYDVLLSWDKRIMAFFLERGADFIGDLSCAHAFHERIRTAPGVDLDCKRRWPERPPQLQEQADVALRQHCHDGNVKWVSLLMWSGADPTSIGPTIGGAVSAGGTPGPALAAARDSLKVRHCRGGTDEGGPAGTLACRAGMGRLGRSVSGRPSSNRPAVLRTAS
jgi:hypothetical protein